MAALLGIFLFLGVSLADEVGHCNLVQTASEMRRKKGKLVKAAKDTMPLQPLSDQKDQGICLTDYTDQEMKRPLEEVVSAYGEDGWCVFGGTGSWASECAISRKTRVIDNFITQYEPTLKKHMNSPSFTPFTLKLPDGRTLTTRDHSYPYDDLYCFANGWYMEDTGDQRSALMNFSYLEEVSERNCNKLEAILPEYHSLTYSDFQKESSGDEAFLIKDLKKDGQLEVPESVVRGMLVHAAVKCQFRGGGKGAVCDIANCAARACLDEKNNVRYTQAGECTKLT